MTNGDIKKQGDKFIELVVFILFLSVFIVPIFTETNRITFPTILNVTNESLTPVVQNANFQLDNILIDVNSEVVRNSSSSVLATTEYIINYDLGILNVTSNNVTTQMFIDYVVTTPPVISPVVAAFMVLIPFIIVSISFKTFSKRKGKK